MEHVLQRWRSTIRCGNPMWAFDGSPLMNSSNPASAGQSKGGISTISDLRYVDENRTLVSTPIAVMRCLDTLIAPACNVVFVLLRDSLHATSFHSLRFPVLHFLPFFPFGRLKYGPAWRHIPITLVHDADNNRHSIAVSLSMHMSI